MLFDFLLVFLDHGRVVGGHDQVEEFVYFLVHAGNLALACAQVVCRLVTPRVPDATEHVCQQLNGCWIRLECFDDVADVAFKLVALDRLAIVLAGLGLAEVIGIVPAIAFCDGGSQRNLTAIADSDSTQSKGITNVFTFRGFGLGCAALLHFVEGFERDQRFMLGFEPIDPIVFRADMPRVYGLRQNASDLLLFQNTVLEMREIWEFFKEALHLGLCFKATRGKALERLPYEVVKGRIRHKYLSAPFLSFIAIANGRIVYPVSRFHAGAHLLGDLPCVLFALKLALGGKDGFHELAFRRIVEAIVQTFQSGVAGAEGLTQTEVEVPVASKAFQIVEDYDEGLIRLGVHEGQQRHETGALHKIATTRHRIRKDCENLVPFGVCVLATPGFLRLQAVAVGLLPFG